MEKKFEGFEGLGFVPDWDCAEGARGSSMPCGFPSGLDEGFAPKVSWSPRECHSDTAAVASFGAAVVLSSIAPRGAGGLESFCSMASSTVLLSAV